MRDPGNSEPDASSGRKDIGARTGLTALAERTALADYAELTELTARAERAVLADFAELTECLALTPGRNRFGRAWRLEQARASRHRQPRGANSPEPTCLAKFK